MLNAGQMSTEKRRLLKETNFRWSGKISGHPLKKTWPNTQSKKRRWMSGNTSTLEKTPLHRMCIQQNLHNMWILFKTSTPNLNAVDTYLRVPLHYACVPSKNSIAAVKLLLDVGSFLDLDAKDVSGYPPLATPVMHAYTSSHEVEKCARETVRLLLGEGASGDIKVNNILHAIHLSASNGDDQMISALLESGSPVDKRVFISHETPLILAAFNGHVSTMEILLDNGADINARNKYGYTSLMVICLAPNPSLPCAELLIERGANLELREYAPSNRMALGMIPLVHNNIRRLLFDANTAMDETQDAVLGLLRLGW